MIEPASARRDHERKAKGRGRELGRLRQFRTVKGRKGQAALYCAAADIGPVLMPRLDNDAVLMTDRARAYSKLGKANGVEVRVVRKNSKHQTTRLRHLNNVGEYHEKLKG
jgi:hypothetical protein